MTKTRRETNANPSTFKDVVVPATTMLLSDILHRDESDPPKHPPWEGQGEAIRVLAYQTWEAAGCPEGDGKEFWPDAEQEVKVEQLDTEAFQTSRYRADR